MTSIRIKLASFAALILTVCFVVTGIASQVVRAQSTVINYNVADLVPKSDIVVTPPSGTFQEGSTFEVPIFVNTHNNNINAVELAIRFTPGTLSVVRPSGGKSIIGLWVEPPSYDNTKGTVRIVGAIPGGITSNSGLIVTVTFKAKAPGQATVDISDSSQVLLNDGAGTPTTMHSSRGAYTIVPQPPGGVNVFSDTHPFQDRWYNNPNPILSWDRDPGVTGFGYVLDDKPNTIPGNDVTSNETSKAYPDLPDGLSYFHIKSRKQGVWGATTNYILRIDTAPPAAFTPQVDYLSATTVNRFLISFFTTDSLSGVDHYEVGIIDKNAPATESPVFLETESPYQLPFSSSENARVIVRAFDRAGNLRDSSIDVSVPFLPFLFFSEHTTLLLTMAIILMILAIVTHYLHKHNILSRLHRAMKILSGNRKSDQ